MDKMARRTSRLVAAAAVATGAVVATPGEASAHHGWGWGADDTHMEWERTLNTWNTIAYDATGWGANTLAVTNLDLFEQTGWTDIEAYIDEFINKPVAGIGGCWSYWPNSNDCDRSISTYARWTLDGGGNDDFSVAEYKYLGCHEMGHTGGVAERFDNVSCLQGTKPPRLPNSDNVDDKYKFLTGVEPNSDIGEINYWIVH